MGVWNDAELVDLDDECGLLPAWGGVGGEVDHPLVDRISTGEVGLWSVVSGSGGQKSGSRGQRS